MFFLGRKKKRRTEKELLAWQSAVMENPPDHLVMSEAFLEKFTAMELENAVEQIIESVDLVRHSKYQDTVLGRVAYIKLRMQFVEKVRPFVEIPAEYPQAEVDEIIKMYPEVKALESRH